MHHLRRVLEIFRLAAERFRVMETLTPQNFLAFRSKLGTASGFQSLQMREIEAIMGLEEKERAFLTGAEIAPESERSRMCRIRAALLFIESYRELPLLARPRLLLDTVVEMEELFILWRTRHARMVARVIGRRVGTGGPSGVDYLDETAQYRIFPESLAVRTLLLPRHVMPPLQHAELYNFATAKESAT